MNHLTASFRQHIGHRGCHFYDYECCNFLPWNKVFQFLDTLIPEDDSPDIFSEKLTEALANYNPDTEYLAVRQDGDLVSIELYANSREISANR